MVPITTINTRASFDKIVTIENDYTFKKGNTDWTLYLTLEKNGTLFDNAPDTIFIVEGCETVGEVTSDNYTYHNGVITIEGLAGMVASAGTFYIYIAIDNNVSYKIKYTVQDDISVGDILPLPDIDSTLYGSLIALDSERPQSITSKIDELDEYLDNINDAVTTNSFAIIDLQDKHKYYENVNNVGGTLTTVDQTFGTINGYDAGIYRLYAQGSIVRNDAGANEQTISLTVYDGLNVVVSAEFSAYKDFSTSVTLTSGIKYNLTGGELTLVLRTTGGSISVNNLSWSIEGGI